MKLLSTIGNDYSNGLEKGEL